MTTAIQPIATARMGSRSAASAKRSPKASTISGSRSTRSTTKPADASTPTPIDARLQPPQPLGVIGPRGDEARKRDDADRGGQEEERAGEESGARVVAGRRPPPRKCRASAMSASASSQKQVSPRSAGAEIAADGGEGPVRRLPRAAADAEAAKRERDRERRRQRRGEHRADHAQSGPDERDPEGEPEDRGRELQGRQGLEPMLALQDALGRRWSGPTPRRTERAGARDTMSTSRKTLSSGASRATTMPARPSERHRRLQRARRRARATSSSRPVERSVAVLSAIAVWMTPNGTERTRTPRAAPRARRSRPGRAYG